jgi:hypothetical protein
MRAEAFEFRELFTVFSAFLSAVRWHPIFMA